MTVDTIITKKYVSKKIKTLRWKPPATNFDKANIFVTGSWDDEVRKMQLFK